MGREKGKDKRKEREKEKDAEEAPAQEEMMEIAPPEEQQNVDYMLNERGIPVYPDIQVPTALESVATYDPKGPRLMISHITNENFKSYAGVKVLGPFHKSFSSIVGPNGSGKSNVIDSMLFVFGYRANKIRSKKISILIHNSDRHPNVTSCTVTVHFQKIIDTGEGEDDYDLVPNSQFSVSRTAFKDNSSYYKINDRKATYKEVATLLRGSGIDLDHNRFLILQGEVEQISLMKPKAQTEHDEGMLEFLEDIIGSNRFKVPIEQLAKRVEHLSEVRVEKLNRVKAVEKEKDDLEGVKNEALEYLRKENEIVRKKNMLFQKYIAECQESQDKAKVKQDEIQEGMKDVTERLKAINEQKSDRTKEIKQTYKKYDALSKACDEKKEEFAKFEQDDVRCREQLKHSKGRAKKLDKQLEQEKKKLEELKAIPEKMERDVVEYKKKLEKLETEKAVEEEKLKVVMESLKTETLGLQQEKEAKETELIDLEKVVNETRSKFNVGQAELDLFNSNQRSEQAKLRETERNLETAEKNLKEKQKAVEEAEKKLPELEKNLIKAQKDVQQISQKEATVSEAMRSTRVKVEEVRTTLSSARSRGKVLDALMAEKRAGRITGVYGRLGDLGAIDEKYDVAISTACGALDNILVDSINTAQRCVEFLKKSGVGSATFIGLDKMARWKANCSQKITTPENVPRLFDLVKVNDPEVQPAFYFALRDTLVAKNLDQATRIAYGKTRYRVVTLEGQLIDTSGTMSGGGGRVARGRMGSTVISDVNPAQLDHLEAQLKKETTEAQSLHAEKLKLEESVMLLSREVNQMKHALEKTHMELRSLPGQVESLTKQKKECEERVKAAAPDEKTLKKMEKQVEADKKEFDKAKAAASKVQDAVHELHKQIMEIGGSKLKAAESKVNMVSTQIDQIMGHITKANVSIKNAGRNATKSQEKVGSLEEEIKENKETLEKLEVEFKQLEEDATGVLQAFQKAQEDMKAVEEELNQMKLAYSKLEEEEEKLEKDNVEVKHELEKYETIIKDNTAKIRHWNKELSKLSLHKIESSSITSDGEEEDDGQKELEKYETEYLHGVNTDDTRYAITVLEEKLASMKPNMAAIAEYKKKEEMYMQRVADLDYVTEMRNEQRRLHDDLRKQRLDEFMTGFTIITGKLKEMYQMITLGGDAELELVDSLDPFSEGIVFSVRPPKKSWKVISSLSGGEKTLSSLALVFALHHYKPTPLYVMDEIDAALDFKNVSIVANYIKERTKNAQFIIISLRNNMFELADRLIGIFKTYDATKSVTINPTKIPMPLPAS